MSDRDLAAVEGFTVWNKLGKIEFEGRTDVRDIDLDMVVFIDHKNVEVYPASIFPTDESKPVPGEKLNKPAIITLFQCFPKSQKENQDPKGRRTELIRKYEKQAHKSGYDFIDYDDVNGVYRIRVRHF